MALRILVVVQGYPSPNDRYNLAYVHTRLLGYIERGLDVTVLNFSAKANYVYEGVRVINESHWLKVMTTYDVLIAHAPNLRNHLRFLQKHGAMFPRWLFFFHGHEVLNKQAYYPAPYNYESGSNGFWRIADRAYDFFKLRVLRPVLEKWLNQGHLELIFVSGWMRQAFFDNVKAKPELVMPHAHIIPNAVHPAFLSHQWQALDPLNADCITIRPLDNPKYAIDQVCVLAKANPHLRFHIFGRGDYFQHHLLPKNVVWFNRFLTPEEMIHLLPRYRCAVMPTRLDAQGVMMCELASYGIPLITSDLPICREMLAPFKRVHYLPELEDSQDPTPFAHYDLKSIIEQLVEAPSPAQQPFAFDALIDQEYACITQESALSP